MFGRGVRWLLPYFLALAVASAAEAAAAPYELQRLFTRGRYDEVIQKASEEMQNAVAPDPTVRYLRGRAYYNIAWFGAAEADLTPLGDYALGTKWPKASETVTKIATLRRLAPSNVQEVRVEGRVLFRVYYDADDEYTRAYLAALPEARRAVCEFFGREMMTETVIFLFKDPERCEAFRLVWNPSQAERKWSEGTGNRGFVTICLRRPSGKFVSRHPLDVAELLRHELTHVIHRRYVGTASVPTWFEEGMAQYCGALGRQSSTDENELKVMDIAGKGAHWLPLSVIRDYHQFYTEENNSLAYTQSFAMVRYMMTTYGKEKVLHLFMEGLGADCGVDLAFVEALGVDQEGFYRQWFGAPS